MVQPGQSRWDTGRWSERQPAGRTDPGPPPGQDFNYGHQPNPMAGAGGGNWGGVGATVGQQGGGGMDRPYMADRPQQPDTWAQAPTGISDFEVGADGSIRWKKFDPSFIYGKQIDSATERHRIESDMWKHAEQIETTRYLKELDNKARANDREAQLEQERIRQGGAIDVEKVRQASQQYIADNEFKMKELDNKARAGDREAQLKLGELRAETDRYASDIGLKGIEAQRAGAYERAKLQHGLGMEQVAAGREAVSSRERLEREKMGQGRKTLEFANEMFGISDLLKGGDMGGFGKGPRPPMQAAQGGPPQGGPPQGGPPQGGPPQGGPQGYADTMGTAGPGLGEQNMMNRYASALQGGSLAGIQQGAMQRGQQMMGPQGGMAGVPAMHGNMDKFTAAMSGVANKDKAFARQLQQGQLGAQLMGAMGQFA